MTTRVPTKPTPFPTSTGFGQNTDASMNYPGATVGGRQVGRRHGVCLPSQAGTTSTDEDGPPIDRKSGTEASTTRPVSISKASGRR
jgi:hypothetical protein